MPDRRRHRGADPADAELFTAPEHPVLRRAVAELGWLLSRGYPERAALKLVGDRHTLRERQRRAVLRGTCTDRARAHRRAARREADALGGATVAVDAFNLVITLESALGGAPVFVGRDGAVRDLAGLHGTYRMVEETPAALRLLSEALARARPSEVILYVDAPVSNSGRLRGALEAALLRAGVSGRAELVSDADPCLMRHDGPVLTSDGPVLDAVSAWVDLLGPTVDAHVPHAWRVDLRGGTV